MAYYDNNIIDLDVFENYKYIKKSDRTSDTNLDGIECKLIERDGSNGWFKLFSAVTLQPISGRQYDIPMSACLKFPDNYEGILIACEDIFFKYGLIIPTIQVIKNMHLGFGQIISLHAICIKKKNVIEKNDFIAYLKLVPEMPAVHINMQDRANLYTIPKEIIL